MDATSDTTKWNINDFSIDDLFDALNIPPDPTDTQVTDTANSLIARMRSQGKLEEANFFEQAKQKILTHLDNSQDISDDNDEYNMQNDESTTLGNWWNYQYPPQGDQTQAEKATSRHQKVQFFSNTHQQMNRERLGVNQNYTVPIMQGTINPNQHNTTQKLVYIDSSQRQDNLTNNTDFTLSLSSPITDVTSLFLHSYQIPHTWYTFDTYAGNIHFDFFFDFEETASAEQWFTTRRNAQVKGYYDQDPSTLLDTTTRIGEYTGNEQGFWVDSPFLGYPDSGNHLLPPSLINTLLTPKMTNWKGRVSIPPGSYSPLNLIHELNKQFIQALTKPYPENDPNFSSYTFLTNPNDLSWNVPGRTKFMQIPQPSAYSSSVFTVTDASGQENSMVYNYGMIQPCTDPELNPLISPNQPLGADGAEVGDRYDKGPFYYNDITRKITFDMTTIFSALQPIPPRLTPVLSEPDACGNYMQLNSNGPYQLNGEPMPQTVRANSIYPDPSYNPGVSPMNLISHTAVNVPSSTRIHPIPYSTPPNNAIGGKNWASYEELNQPEVQCTSPLDCTVNGVAMVPPPAFVDYTERNSRLTNPTYAPLSAPAAASIRPWISQTDWIAERNFGAKIVLSFYGDQQDISGSSSSSPPSSTRTYVNQNLGWNLGFRNLNTEVDRYNNVIVNNNLNENFSLTMPLCASAATYASVTAFSNILSLLWIYDYVGAGGLDQGVITFLAPNSEDTNNFTAPAIINTYGTHSIFLLLDDYNQNRVNENCISMSSRLNKLSVPNYYEPAKATEYGGDLAPIDGVDSKARVVKTAPRRLTQAQIYTANEILDNQKIIDNRVPPITTGDVLAIIPVENNGFDFRHTYSPYYTSGLPPLIKTIPNGSIPQRKYFGPVDIERLRVRLVDDKGNLLNLNGNDWSFTMCVEQLYQY